MPGKTSPGFVSSTTIPSRPSEQHQRDDVRVDQQCRGCASSATSRPRSTLAPAVSRRQPLRLASSCRRSGAAGRRVGRDDVDDVPASSASRAPRFGAAGRIASARPSTLRPCSRASSRDVGGGVVDDLAPQVLRDVLAADRDRASTSRCSSAAPSRARRRPRRSRRRPSRALGAGGRDVDDDRASRRRARLDDVAHRRAEPAGRVHLDHDRVEALSLAALDLRR